MSLRGLGSFEPFFFFFDVLFRFQKELLFPGWRGNLSIEILVNKEERKSLRCIFLNDSYEDPLESENEKAK